MEVIKPGKLADIHSWSTIVSCNNCQAELKINYFDIQSGTKMEGNMREEWKVSYKYVTCCECREEIKIKNLPKFKPIK